MRGVARQKADSGAEDNADDAADGAEGHRFNEELSKNIAALGANGLSNADSALEYYPQKKRKYFTQETGFEAGRCSR